MSFRPYCWIAIGIAIDLVGCGSIRDEMNQVIVTAVPAEVGKCKNLGAVATDSPENTPTSGIDQLRAQAVRLGGNTVLVASYAQSTTGTAYLCKQPLPPR